MTEENPEPQPSEEPKNEPDWKAEARKWEQRAKENRSAAERLEQIENENKSELEKAQSQLQALQSERDSALREAYAASQGIPASMVTGTSREQWEASAKAALEWRDSSRAPAPKSFKSGSGKGEQPITGKEKAAAALRSLSR